MGRRARLNTERVVQAAAHLANTQGVEALTLNRLAEELGIQPPSLYNHIAGWADLQQKLALMNVRALADCLAQAAIGKAGGEAVMAVAQAYRQYIKTYPGQYLASLQASNNQTLPNPELQQAEQRVVEIVLAAMSAFQLQGDDAIHAVRGLRSVVHGFTTLELAGGFGLPLDCEESFQRLLHMLIVGLPHQAASK